MVVFQEQTLNEDSMWITNMMIDSEIKSFAEEEHSSKKQKSDIVKAIQDRLKAMKSKGMPEIFEPTSQISILNPLAQPKNNYDQQKEGWDCDLQEDENDSLDNDEPRSTFQS